jgi:hypothetical protein
MWARRQDPHQVGLVPSLTVKKHPAFFNLIIEFLSRVDEEHLIVLYVYYALNVQYLWRSLSMFWLLLEDDPEGCTDRESMHFAK